MAAPRSISFGFLLIPLQAIDMVGPMDILFNISHQVIATFMSADLANSLGAPDITFHHISSSYSSMDPIVTTGNLHIAPTTNLRDCPKLDYLLIGGPAPTYAENLPKEVKEFIVKQSKEVRTIFTTCTGGLVLSATGLLDGLEATTNHALIVPYGENISPSTKWNRQKHWVVSSSKSGGADFWTGAGASAGMDMFAQWIKEEFEHGQKLLDVSTLALEWQPRDIDGKSMKYVNGRGETVEV